LSAARPVTDRARYENLHITPVDVIVIDRAADGMWGKRCAARSRRGVSFDVSCMLRAPGSAAELPHPGSDVTPLFVRQIESFGRALS